jgi:hypothetical protein
MVTPFIPTEEELAERAAWKLRLQRPASGHTQPPEPDSAPAPPPPRTAEPAPKLLQLATPFVPTAEELAEREAMKSSKAWTSYLRPVNAPVPDW